jgi:hypothetical protein
MHGGYQVFLPRDVDWKNAWYPLGLSTQGCLSKKCLAITKPLCLMMLVGKCLATTRRFSLWVVMVKTLNNYQAFHSMDGQWKNAQWL